MQMLTKYESKLNSWGGIHPQTPPTSRPKASFKSVYGLSRNRLSLQPFTYLGRPEADLNEALGLTYWECLESRCRPGINLGFVFSQPQARMD